MRAFWGPDCVAQSLTACMAASMGTVLRSHRGIQPGSLSTMRCCAVLANIQCAGLRVLNAVTRAKQGIDRISDVSLLPPETWFGYNRV